MIFAEFAKAFSSYDVPPELAKLFEFDAEHGFENYSQGFGLRVDDKAGLASWSEAEGFSSKLIPFAQATGTGSFYALWTGGPAKTTSQMPVVVFGDEGGIFVVAENMKGLLELLTYDSEPSVSLSGVFFDKDLSYWKPTRFAEKYRRWVNEELGLTPIENPNALVEQAQKKCGAFEAWLAEFVKSD